MDEWINRPASAPLFPHGFVDVTVALVLEDIEAVGFAVGARRVAKRRNAIYVAGRESLPHMKLVKARITLDEPVDPEKHYSDNGTKTPDHPESKIVIPLIEKFLASSLHCREDDEIRLASNVFIDPDDEKVYFGLNVHGSDVLKDLRVTAETLVDEFTDNTTRYGVLNNPFHVTGGHLFPGEEIDQTFADESFASVLGANAKASVAIGLFGNGPQFLSITSRPRNGHYALSNAAIPSASRLIV